MSDFLEARYEKDPSIVYREIADEVVLVPIRHKMADMESVYNLRGVGAFIWNLIDGGNSLEGIKKSILEEFDVDPLEAECDLIEFVQDMERIGVIRVAS
jgi:hypothetical protein